MKKAHFTKIGGGGEINRALINRTFCCFSDITVAKYNLYKYFKDFFFSCLDTAMDNK